MTNAEIEQHVDTSDEWIRERTGIVERFLADDEPTSHMAVEWPNRWSIRAVSIRSVSISDSCDSYAGYVFPSCCVHCSRRYWSGAWAYDLSAAQAFFRSHRFAVYTEWHHRALWLLAQTR